MTSTTSPVALVTGSAVRGRIGATLLQALARRDYRCVIHCHSSLDAGRELQAELQAGGTECQLLSADLSDQSQVETLIKQVVDSWGRIDFLANCAAIWRSKSLEDTTADDLRDHFEANVLSTFLCSRAAGLQMVQQPQGGCIVTFGDWAECRPPLNRAAYWASKGAIPALTRTLAVELGRRNPRVRVNCIHPGPVQPEGKALSPEDEIRYVQNSLVGRSARPEDIAQAALSLSDNDFLTGICLPVDGGRSCYAAGSLT